MRRGGERFRDQEKERDGEIHGGGEKRETKERNQRRSRTRESVCVRVCERERSKEKNVRESRTRERERGDRERDQGTIKRSRKKRSSHTQVYRCADPQMRRPRDAQIHPLLLEDSCSILREDFVSSNALRKIGIEGSLEPLTCKLLRLLRLALASPIPRAADGFASASHPLS